MDMKKIASPLVALLCLMVSFAVWADNPPQPSANSANSAAAQAMIPSPPEIAASSYVLLAANSDKVIVQKNAHEHLPPASLTKLMTLYITFKELAQGRITLDDKVPVSVNAWKTGGSRMFLREGTKVSVKELLHGIIVDSGNDATVAMAEYIAGSEGAFADIMNQQARLLGMKDTHYEDPTGLPIKDHYSSAFDLAKLARAIIEQYPQYYHFFDVKYFTYNGIRQPNRNLLLWRDPRVDGLKTGHTEAAGYCLVASGIENGTRLISVVMHTDSEEARARESEKLLDYGFRYYRTFKLFNKGQSLMSSRVWGGKQDKFPLGVTRDIYVTIPRGTKPNLKSNLNVQKVIKAPVKQGQQYGDLKVSLGNEQLVDQPLVALKPVDEGGFFKRIWDAIRLFFINLFS